MHIKAFKTARIEGKNSCLEDIIEDALPKLENGDILALTSKIVSLCQGRYICKEETSKYDLICQEADLLLQTDQNPYNLFLTIKDGLLIPSAGIDASNGLNVYILYPKDIQEVAFSLWNHLRTKFKLQDLGILITDSHTTPLRRGVTGIALGWCGFEPLYSYVNKPDVYGQPLCVTQINILDALAASAVFVIGEGDEQTPLALIQKAPKISFLDRPPTSQEEQSIKISLEEDLYAPLFQSVKWLKVKHNF
ncbi:MAG: coenzyme F420-0:L-glutamate ligase [Proteobacteria bacterium]|nr:coenzyme F420-0:L-glutamate ligase [Pseudomonadota bacterium]